MGKLFNNKILKFIPFVFLFFIAIGIFYNYMELKQNKLNFVQQEARLLQQLQMEHRTYYQNRFIEKSIRLNKQTLSSLPAYSSSLISSSFSEINSLNIITRTVSDRARNEKNQADKDELEAIKFFNTHMQAKEYLSESNEVYYQYAYPLKITQVCLTCHGKKEDAPLFIQEKYSNSYDYKLGELRGILSIKIPKETVDSYFFPSFLRGVVFDIVILVFLFFVMRYIIKESNYFNDYLASEITLKAYELKNTLDNDSLTEIPNRGRLLEDIKNYQLVSNLHLALLNIDNFKDINDFYGYTVGDEILVEIKDIFTSLSAKHNYLLYKLPSDEFAILSTLEEEKSKFTEIIKEIILTIDNTSLTKDNDIFITISSGLSFDSKNSFLEADMALKTAKEHKLNLAIYDPSIHIGTDVTQNMKGLSIIKDAIENNLLVPFYQPIYELKTKQITKYESLIRIVQKDGTIISPYKFLDIAVKSKLYSNITKTVITKSFEYFRDKKDLSFSVNLSFKDINSTKTVEFIQDSIQKFPNPQRITFEILETDKIEDYQLLKQFISQMKVYGVKFAIDDFGSGYSNFTHILELELDYLKIDASIIKNVRTSEFSRKTIHTIVNLASSINIQTIAEYVEDEESMELLEEIGVDFIQGYHIGKPEPTILPVL